MTAATERNGVDEDRTFRQALGQFATGVTVITTVHEGKPVGVTANSFSSLSLQPRLILWSIRKESTNIAAFRGASHFAVNILASDQIGISQHFARSVADKFSGVKWRAGVGGAPVLAGSLATFECEMHALHEGGDHFIIVGRVAAFDTVERKPLVFAQGRYGLVSELPIVRNETAGPSKSSVVDFPDGATLVSLLNRAQAVMAERFGAIRADEHVTYAQSRVLSALDRQSTYDFEGLLAATVMGRRDLFDVLRSLVEMGLLVRTEGDAYELTEAGRERRRSIGRSWLKFQAEELADIPQADVDATRRVLSRLAARSS